MDQNIQSNTEQDTGKGTKGINPVSAVLGAIVIALIVSSINLVLFIRSDMYMKVKLIQNPEQVLSSDAILDTTSPLNSDQFKQIQKDINSQFELLRDENDYSVYDVSEVSLGI